MSVDVVPFGKYRDQPVEALLADRNYCQWALAQPGLREKYPELFDVVLGVGGVRPEDTPEHNVMQMRFLDHREALRLTAPWLPTGDALREEWTQDAAHNLTDRQRSNLITGNPCSMINGLTFEAHGWDVAVSAGVTLPVTEVADLTCECACDPSSCPVREVWDYGGIGTPRTEPVRERVGTNGPVHEWSAHYDHYSGRRTKHCASDCPVAWVHNRSRTPYEQLRGSRSRVSSVLVELKPIVGDDYPSILRDVMRRWRRSAHMVEASGLLVLADRAEFSGVTLAQVKALYATQNVRFMITAELPPSIECECSTCITTAQTEVRPSQVR